MILAGVLLKMGGYGILRICYPICPLGGFDFAYVICFDWCSQHGLWRICGDGPTRLQKRLVAYSSVSHMGYVVLGLGVWSAAVANGNPDLMTSTTGTREYRVPCSK